MPEKIYLNDNEKFYDTSGNPCEIETLGERGVHKKVYFNARDISIMCNMPKLLDTIKDKDCKYIKNEHYVYFFDNETNKPKLYLTFAGMTKTIIGSKNDKTKPYIDWANNTLCVAQMGTEEQKNMLVSNIKGIPYDTIQELFSRNATDLSCLYLTALGYVKDLREVMNLPDSIPDDYIVYKFGMTKSLEIRKNGHRHEFKELEKYIELKLIKYAHIDPAYLAEAKNELKITLKQYKINYKNFNELVAMPKNSDKMVDNMYKSLGEKYMGRNEKIIKKIK